MVGAINSLTGSNVLTGHDEKWAQEKAVADINAEGGVKLTDGKMYKIVLKYADDKSDPTAGAAAMEQLIKVDGLKLILSSNITPVNQAAPRWPRRTGCTSTSPRVGSTSPPLTGASRGSSRHGPQWPRILRVGGESPTTAAGALEATDPADAHELRRHDRQLADGTGFGNATTAARRRPATTS